MASFEVQASQRPDVWGVSIGGVEGDFIGIAENVKLGFAPTTQSIRSARTGKSVGLWNDETEITLELTITQSALEDWQRFLDAGAGSIPEQGFLPTRRLRLHDPAAANANGDLLFYAVAFVGVDNDTDGSGPKRLVVKLRCTNDSTGAKFKLGATF